MMRVTAIWLTLFLLLVGGSSCGYLDHDIFTDDAQFEESFGSGGIGMSGIGSSGCGGGWGFGHHRTRLASYRVGGLAMLELEAMSIQAMSDQQILENTDIGVIDESEPASTPRASAPEQAYYDQLEKRNRSITETY